MNGPGGGGGDGRGRRKVGGPPTSNRSKERDEDLLLFREMHKREKDRIVSLLQPVSDEFEPTGGNYALYKMASVKKGPAVDNLAENEKNDYDWLKTPPATPLFPSLEMEANAAEMVVQRELPIFQPLSRFAGNSETSKKVSSTIGRSKSPTPKSKVPLRSITPSRKPSNNPSTDQKKNSKSTSILNQKVHSKDDPFHKSNAASNQKESHLNFLASNLSKSIGLDLSKTKPTSRGVSPQVRSSKLPSQIPGISDETPPNLKTDRSGSALRGRSGENPQNLKTDRSGSALRGRSGQSENPQNLKTDRPLSTLRSRSSQSENPQNLKTDRAVSTLRGRSGAQIQNQTYKVREKGEDSTAKASRRQSCSPSANRGRKVVPKDESSTSEENAVTPKGKFQTGNAGQVFGSRMVDKFLNARKSNAEERDAKLKLYGSINEGTGFGRLMTKSSLDIIAKPMQDNKRDSVNIRLSATGRRSTNTTSSTSSSKVSNGSNRQQYT